MDEFLRTLPEVIWERVRTYNEVLEDPQSLQNNYITEVEVPGIGMQKTVGNLVTLSETPGQPKGGPPELGEGNAEVLKDVGLDEALIESVTNRANEVREELFAQAAELNAQLQAEIEANYR